MSTVNTALVIGAGIGGLCSALALRRAGITCDIIEATPEMTVFGVGIIQPSNALRALDRLGVAEACLSAGGGFPGWRLYDRSGAMFAEVPNRNVAGPGMPAVNGLPRQSLHQILSDAAAAEGSVVRYGVTANAFEEVGDAVRVRFDEGSTADYDLIVGADGCYSKTRDALFGDEAHPTFTGQGVWRCNFARPADMEWGGVYYGSKSKVGLVPMGPTTMYMFVVTAEPDNRRYEEAELVPTLRATLEDYQGLVATLRDQLTPSSHIVYKPMETLLLPPPWSRGRTVLIGDAVHATTPHLAQGASLAIEDAVVLGDCLAEDRPLREALDTFATRRFPRAKLVVESSVQLGRWELAEWSGTPDPSASFGGLFHEATEAMMQPA